MISTSRARTHAGLIAEERATNRALAAGELNIALAHLDAAAELLRAAGWDGQAWFVAEHQAQLSKWSDWAEAGAVVDPD